MTIRPLHDRVLVRKAREADKTKSGLLVLPETTQQGSQLGLVLAVGEGRSFDGPGREVLATTQDGYNFKVIQRVETERQKPVVHVGDLVLFGKFSGTVVEVDGDEVFILREDEVVAVVEDAPADLLERCQRSEAVAN